MYKRVIPVLLLKDKGLVKTVKFKNEKYIGDPINAVKIFNEKEVDELVFTDITASKNGKGPDFNYIQEIATECFMPLGYAGGLKKVDEIKKLFYIGVEKAIINQALIHNPDLVKESVKDFGSQSIIASIDIKKNFWGKYEVYDYVKQKGTGISPLEFAKKMEDLGVGEIILNSVDRDGTFEGYDDKILEFSHSLNVPVIINGGAKNYDNLSETISDKHISGVAAGSLFVFHGKLRAVLINYPETGVIKKKY